MHISEQGSCTGWEEDREVKKPPQALWTSVLCHRFYISADITQLNPWCLLFNWSAFCFGASAHRTFYPHRLIWTHSQCLPVQRFIRASLTCVYRGWLKLWYNQKKYKIWSYTEKTYFCYIVSKKIGNKSHTNELQRENKNRIRSRGNNKTVMLEKHRQKYQLPEIR